MLVRVCGGAGAVVRDMPGFYLFGWFLSAASGTCLAFTLIWRGESISVACGFGVTIYLFLHAACMLMVYALLAAFKVGDDRRKKENKNAR